MCRIQSVQLRIVVSDGSVAGAGRGKVVRKQCQIDAPASVFAIRCDAVAAIKKCEETAFFV